MITDLSAFDAKGAISSKLSLELSTQSARDKQISVDCTKWKVVNNSDMMLVLLLQMLFDHVHRNRLGNNKWSIVEM